jgi:uncharacterized ubiquitin-like protein YukD
VIVKRKGENRLRDLQVPADISAASLADLIARILSWENDATSQTVHNQIEVHPLGRVLRPDESLASAGIRDGAWLVLQPAPSPAIQVSLGVEANRPQPDRLAGFVWKQLDE